MALDTTNKAGLTLAAAGHDEMHREERQEINAINGAPAKLLHARYRSASGDVAAGTPFEMVAADSDTLGIALPWTEFVAPFAGHFEFEVNQVHLASGVTAAALEAPSVHVWRWKVAEAKWDSWLSMRTFVMPGDDHSLGGSKIGVLMESGERVRIQAPQVLRLVTVTIRAWPTPESELAT